MDIYTMPGHLIRRLNQISVGLFGERMAGAGLTLTPVQYAALSGIRANPGVDQATLAGLVAYDRATLGKVIDRLEARRLVTRTTSTKDRRAKTLALTRSGVALLDAADPHVKKVQPDILAGLNADERAEFLAMLTKITMAGNDRSRAPLIPPPDESGK
jgi:MarR family transcriptional regulator, temperature-dependent positive regulator of motility